MALLFSVFSEYPICHGNERDNVCKYTIEYPIVYGVIGHIVFIIGNLHSIFYIKLNYSQFSAITVGIWHR